MTVNEMIGERIHVEMRRRRLSQEALADSLYISQSALSKKLRGSRPFAVNELIAISQQFGLPLGELLPKRVKASELGLEFTTFGDKHRQTAAA